MSDADKAYAEAERMIEELKQRLEAGAGTGQSNLNFNTPQTWALEEIPKSISGLTGLHSLNLHGTKVRDLSPVKALQWLERLNLRKTPVIDLSPLENLKRLSHLYLNNTRITDITVLAKLKGLRELLCANSSIEDISALGALSKLVRLELDETAVLDLRPLRRLTGIAKLRGFLGLTFEGCAAARLDPQIKEIARNKDNRERVGMLFHLIDQGWVPPVDEDMADTDAEEDIEIILKGPILSDALSDVAKGEVQFEATSLTDEPERAKDAVYRNALETLSYVAERFGRVETANRIGRDLAVSFKDYSSFAQKEPLNPRLLNYLASGIRGAITDEDLLASLDVFDTEGIAGFLGEHDTLIRDYYPTALRGPQFEAETDPDRLVEVLFPKLDAAREILAQADRDGLFAPSVSDALEMLHRRAEGARKKLLTTGDEAEREKALADLRRNSVLVTAYLGRIKGRLVQWIDRQAAWAKENPAAAVLAADGLVGVATRVIEALSPVFGELWALIGNLPLPF